MVLLHSTGQKGTCYVETKSLDGETNLKIKTVQRDVYDRFSSAKGPAPDLVDLKAYVHCELPNNAIYKFEGNMEIQGLREKGGRGPKTISLGH